MNTMRAILAGVVCLAAARVCAAAAGPEGVASIVERFEHLTVGDAKQVSGLILSSGHFDCRLSAGRAAPVLAGDEVVGIYYDGGGTMSYVSADPLEASTFSYNVRKVSSLKLDKTDQGVRVTDGFARVLWLAQGRPLPPIEGAAAAPLTESFSKQREKFRRANGPSPAQEFALRALDSPSAPVVRAELEGGSGDVVYQLDSEDPAETLTVLRKSWSDDPEMRKHLYPENLSVQLVGRDPKDPPVPRVVLADVDVDLKASDADRGALTVVETLIPLGRPASAIRMELERTVYTTFGNNLATRTEQLRRVTDEKGRELGFVHDRDQMVVQLAEPAAPDVPIKLKFEIDGDFLVHPGGDSYWELGTEPWFPQPQLAGQFYTFHCVVRVKKPFVAFAPGKTVRRAAEGDVNVLETRVEKPVCFAVILAGAYEVEEEVKNGVTLRVATYALKNPRAVKQLTNLAANIIQYYEEFLGPFPMPELNIIEINDFGFGQAPPGTMFITREAFNPLIEEENQLYSQGVNERFAHEIAHQYWGTAVKMPSHEEQWLTESFAEYSAALFLKAYKNEATFNALVKHWRARATFVTSEVTIPLANRGYASDATTRFFLRTGLLYDKGPAVLRALHKELGDETFFTFLKSCQKSFAWKFASTKKMAGLLQYMTKKDYMPFFDRYYWGIEMPKD
jgi:hypothetical protein